MRKPHKITARHLSVLSEMQEAISEQSSHEALREIAHSKFDRVLEELSRQPEALDWFFAAVELAATGKAAEAIARHSMRRDEVQALIRARKAEIQAQKDARKAKRETPHRQT